MSAPRIPVAVLGASGYTGGELLRLLDAHPSLEASFLGANDAAGEPVTSSHPNLASYAGRRFDATRDFDPAGAKAVLVALPAGAAAAAVPALVEGGLPVVDLGPDFRLPSERYPEWYGFEHPAPAWPDKAAYGLTELFRADVAGAALVANPGCYPTPTVLGLAPLLAAGLLEPDGIVVDGKSGISGAGKKLTPASQFASLDGSVQAYRVATHQHTPEMELALGGVARTPVSLTFVPHLVPAVRGIVTTSYARLSPGTDGAMLRDALASAYAGEPFVRVLTDGGVPEPKRLTGSNACELAVWADARAGTAVVVGAIDNLGKGAAGQAVQNLNVLLGIEETAGLSATGVYP
jgi:N-acetyl-gamma-glutamyl-phosphate reductase